jgi:hypothetical protein
MTEITAEKSNGILRCFRRSNLTKEQVFRLWRCAIKDDDQLVDEMIHHVYEDIVAFDCKRATSVMDLIVRRNLAAGWALQSLLKETRAVPRASR